jgi:hypothetical protein
MAGRCWSVAAGGAAAAFALAVAGAAECRPKAADWAAIAACARAATDETRHSCMDYVLHRAGLLPTSTAPAQAAAAASVPAAPASEPAGAGAGPATSAAQRQRFGLPAPVPRSEQKLDAVLADARVDGEGKLVLLTSEGAVWREVESDPVLPPPTPGQPLAIEKASLGGYVCRLGRWVAFRCLRLH